MLAVTTVRHIDGTADAQDITPINILEAHRPACAQYGLRWSSEVSTDIPYRRLLNWASHPDNFSIKSPKGGIKNVALADPDSLTFSEKTGYLWSKATGSWVVSTLLGQTEYFHNEDEGIRQICVTPFTQGWHRFTAVLGIVSGQRALFFQSWKGGITFGTNRYGSNGLSVVAKRDKTNCAPIEGTLLKAGKESKCAMWAELMVN